VALDQEDARNTAGQAAAPGRRKLFASAATGLVIGAAGVVVAREATAPAAPRAVTPAAPATGGTDWLNVTGAPYHADPAGGSDSTPGIRQALSDAGSMSRPVPVYLPSGDYRTTGPLIVPAGVTLIGSGEATIVPSPDWRANGDPAGVIVIDGSTRLEGPSIIRVAIDGQQLAVAASGILSASRPVNALLQDVTINRTTNHGVDASGNGDAWYLERVTAWYCGQNGFNIGIPDCTYTDCIAIYNGNHGWYTVNGTNCRLTGCRSEWNKNHGYYITGTSAATGGMQLTGCSTDRNGVNGVHIDARGTWPVLLTGMMLRRDGRDGTGEGYAALCVNGSSNPVIIDGMTVFPGFNDDGTGTQSPGYGIAVTGPAGYVSVTNAYLHVLTAGILGRLPNGRAIATRIGAWSSSAAVTLVADTH